jgi:hypothetical protein
MSTFQSGDPVWHVTRREFFVLINRLGRFRPRHDPGPYAFPRGDESIWSVFDLGGTDWRVTQKYLRRAVATFGGLICVEP